MKPSLAQQTAWVQALHDDHLLELQRKGDAPGEGTEMIEALLETLRASSSIVANEPQLFACPLGGVCKFDRPCRGGCQSKDAAPNGRAFPICEDHQRGNWNEPELDGTPCILCRLFYLEAQESLLEEWQQRATRAEESILEVKRPLDAQMARLNATVERLNGENEVLRAARDSAQFVSGLSAERNRLLLSGNEKIEKALTEKLAKALAPPTHDEIAAYRNLFRTELDKRMDTSHSSSSPSTESHEVALRAFVEKRNAA